MSAFADGNIRLTPTNNSLARVGPGFLTCKGTVGRKEISQTGQGRSELYTAETVAKFLDWPVTKVQDILESLRLIELNVLNQSNFKGLGPEQARKVTEQANALIMEVFRAEIEGVGGPNDRGESLTHGLLRRFDHRMVSEPSG